MSITFEVEKSELKDWDSITYQLMGFFKAIVGSSLDPEEKINLLQEAIKKREKYREEGAE